ncbi:MAG: mechanosensitive ion channel domain-containing protein [Pseudomonadota bacterium]
MARISQDAGDGQEPVSSVGSSTPSQPAPQPAPQPADDAAPLESSASEPEALTPEPSVQLTTDENVTAPGLAANELSTEDPAVDGSEGAQSLTDGSALEALIGADQLRGTLEKLLVWLADTVLTPATAVQLAILIAALIPAALFGPQLKRVINGQVAPRAPYGVLRRAANAFAHIATPIALYVVLQIAVGGLKVAGWQSGLVEAGASLLTAWIVIRLVTLVIRSPFWSKTAFYLAWPVAALDAFGLLDDVVRQLEAASLPIGENAAGDAITFSALDFVRTLITFGVLFWLAGFVNRFLVSRLEQVDELTPSLQALLAKILNVVMPTLAFLLALQIVGFNLATLTVFGGAIGLGVGLGLQRTISNFFAGFTLIADKSIKPGDVIAVGHTFGWVTQMNARYVSVRTRDGTAHLIPNDKFIEDGVVNWSHSDKVVRLHAGFGVAYDTKDLRAVKKMAEETAAAIERVLETPKPVCNMMAFGDSSIDFDLRFWINDPKNGLSNVRSEVLLALWDRLSAEGVEIPFPQRDIYIKSAPEGFTSPRLADTR